MGATAQDRAAHVAPDTGGSHRLLAELRDQLDRAALSIVLNTAEGAGRTGAADKARLFAMARGSAMECAAVLDVLRATGIAPQLVCARGRSLLVRIVQMHTRLYLRLKG
jgi:four helix bundle protein